MDAEEQAAYALYINRELSGDVELADVLPLAADGSDLCDKCRCLKTSVSRETHFVHVFKAGSNVIKEM